MLEMWPSEECLPGRVDARSAPVTLNESTVPRAATGQRSSDLVAYLWLSGKEEYSREVSILWRKLYEVMANECTSFAPVPEQLKTYYYQTYLLLYYPNMVKVKHFLTFSRKSAQCTPQMKLASKLEVPHFLLKYIISVSIKASVCETAIIFSDVIQI